LSYYEDIKSSTPILLAVRVTYLKKKTPIGPFKG